MKPPILPYILGGSLVGAAISTIMFLSTDRDPLATAKREAAFYNDQAVRLSTKGEEYEYETARAFYAAYHAQQRVEELTKAKK